MPAQRASSYSNIRTAFERALEDDRQTLAEEQKACRARARKFSQETNRRRRAQEERRREEDVRELKMREDILQQRKHKVQEATERFQRAHLPPSQRKRHVYRFPTPRLEDALNQIQASFSSSALHSALYPRSPTNRSYTSSPVSSGNSTPSRQQKQLSAAVAYAKLMQEKSGANLRSSQMLFQNELLETQRLLEDRQMNSLQDFQQEVSRLNRSESLSSLDSLEEEHYQGTTAHNKSPSISSLDESASKNCTRPQSPKKHFNGVCPSAKTAIFRAENTSQDQWNQHSRTCANSQPPLPLIKRNEDLIVNKYLNGKPQASMAQHIREANDEDEKSTAESHITRQETLAQNRNVDHASAKTGQDKANAQEDADDKAPTIIPCNAWTTPDPTPLDLQFSAPQDKSTQQVINPEDRYSNKPSATEIFLPNSQLSSEGGSGTTSVFHGTLLNTINKSCTETENTEVLLTEHSKPSPCKNGYQSDAMYAKNSSKKSQNCEKSRDAELSNQTPKSHQVKTNVSEFPLTSEQQTQKTSASGSTSHPTSETKGVRLVKGILKKESKYASGQPGSVHSSSGVIFTKQVAISIKDSMELTRLKDKSMVGNRTKKKLRWLDEVDLNEDREEMQNFGELPRQNQGKSKLAYQLPVKSNLKDVSAGPQESRFHTAAMATAQGPSKTTQAAQATTPVTSTGYHFTKQAWADSRGQDSRLQEQGEEARAGKSCPRKGRQRVPRRVRSARARMSTPSTKARKGTIMRPQSPSEARQIVKTQGKVIKPHPPPKPALPGERQAQTVNSDGEAAVNLPRSLYSDMYTCSKGSPPVDQASYKDIPDGCALPQGSSLSTAGITFTPYPPSYSLAAYEAVTKATYTLSSAQAAAQHEASSGSTRRGPVCGENGLRLDCTPTDDEISQLWHGVRSALATKDAAMNVARRKQILDSNGMKHRSLLEQRRQATSAGTRKPAFTAQGTVQISPFPSKTELAQTPGTLLQDEVSESTAQFLLAENLTETSAADSDILAAMEMLQTQKHTFLQQRAQLRGLSVLSLEEQRLLHSLDRLDHQLLRKTRLQRPTQDTCRLSYVCVQFMTLLLHLSAH
ncbi:centrosomal protein of 126 kDa isoform X2 [Amia ocellicauda]|uniref:centrosomal protein of 126 kDa isoform X2 n=1 Tax=Amia ocellicauda TaxID=2972642 RepID=UPI003463B600